MQLSAANLLIAAQQATKQAPQPPKAPAFAAALASETRNKDALFAPLDFKQAAPAQPPAAGPAPRIGATLDIRV